MSRLYSSGCGNPFLMHSHIGNSIIFLWNKKSADMKSSTNSPAQGTNQKNQRFCFVSYFTILNICLLASWLQSGSFPSRHSSHIPGRKKGTTRRREHCLLYQGRKTFTADPCKLCSCCTGLNWITWPTQKDRTLREGIFLTRFISITKLRLYWQERREYWYFWATGSSTNRRVGRTYTNKDGMKGEKCVQEK